MLRFIIREENTAHVIYGGASKASTTYKTFDINLPELEKLITQKSDYYAVQIDGVEIIESEPKADAALEV